MSKLLVFRKENEFTQREMAKKIGVSISYYAMIELELRTPSYNFIKKFIAAFPESDALNIFLK